MQSEIYHTGKRGQKVATETFHSSWDECKVGGILPYYNYSINREVHYQDHPGYNIYKFWDKWEVLISHIGVFSIVTIFFSVPLTLCEYSYHGTLNRLFLSIFALSSVLLIIALALRTTANIFSDSVGETEEFSLELKVYYPVWNKFKKTKPEKFSFFEGLHTIVNHSLTNEEYHIPDNIQSTLNLLTSVDFLDMKDHLQADMIEQIIAKELPFIQEEVNYINSMQSIHDEIDKSCLFSQHGKYNMGDWMHKGLGR